jgi:hypothetical protein
MTGRAIAETVVSLVLTAILAIVGAGLFELSDGATPAQAFLESGPRLILGAFAIPGVLWVIMLLVGNIRNRRRASGWHFLTNLLSTFVVAVLNVLGWLVVAIVQGNWAWLMVGIAVVVSLLFFVAALVGLLLTHFAIFRHRAASRESVPSVPAGSESAAA